MAKEKLKRIYEEEREARRAELIHKCTQVVEQDTEIYIILDVKLVRLYFRVAGQSFHQHAVQSDQFTKTYPLINN